MKEMEADEVGATFYVSNVGNTDWIYGSRRPFGKRTSYYESCEEGEKEK